MFFSLSTTWRRKMSDATQRGIFPVYTHSIAHAGAAPASGPVEPIARPGV